MSFLHKRMHLNAGQTVEVSLDKQANVLLMDDLQFQNYRSGSSFNYRGGQAKRSPIRIGVPHTGYWNLTIDLGGASGTIRHSIRILG